MTFAARIRTAGVWLLKAGAATRRWTATPGMRPVWAHGLRVGTLVLIVLLVHREVHALLGRQPSFKLRSPSFSAGEEPESSVGRQALADVNAALRDVDASALDETTVEAVGRRLEKCPWVKEVVGVRRVYPNELAIDVILREPLLAVRWGDAYLRVDAAGVRLPGEDREPPATLCWPVVTGVTMAPPPPGQIWNTADLRAAFEMVGVIESSPMLQKLAIAEMDLSNLDGRIRPGGCEIVLRLKGGCEISWGSAPSNRKIWEASVEEKLANLKRVLDARPGLGMVQRVRIFEPGRASIVETSASANR